MELVSSVKCTSNATSTNTENFNGVEQRKKVPIDSILDEMRSQFNRKTIKHSKCKDNSTKLVEDIASHETNNGCDSNKQKPRIVLLLKKPQIKKKDELKQSPIITTGVNGVKMSTRGRTRNSNQSVLESAIARKQRSYNDECTAGKRSTSRQLKPTQKILDNLAMAANHEKRKNGTVYLTVNPLETTRKKPKSTGGKKKIKIVKERTQRTNTNNNDREVIVNGVKSLKTYPSRRSRTLPSTMSSERLKSEEPSIKCEPLMENEKEIIPVNQLVCLCMERSNCFALPSSIEEDSVFCSALDTIDGDVFGCSFIVDVKNTCFLRPSKQLPFGLFCTSHRNRLLRHMCCPNCGQFCTQGRFLRCTNNHYYHKDCNLECCPHCGQASKSSKDVQIRIHLDTKPVFLPVQNTPKHLFSTGRMTFTSSCSKDAEELLLPDKVVKLLNSVDSCNDDSLKIEYSICDLLEAIKNEDVEKVVNILRTKTVDLHAKIPSANYGTLLHYTCQLGDSVTIVHLLTTWCTFETNCFDRDLNTALMLATLNNRNQIVQYLVKVVGVNIELNGTDGMTALHLAAKSGNLRACQILLNCAHCKRITNFVNCADDGGWTPLVWAAEHGFVEVASYLLDHGADSMIRDAEHNLALHWASFNGSTEIVEVLTARPECDLDAANAHGDTPLHIAARQNMYNCVIILLAKGANVTLLNKNNESALDCVPVDGASAHPIALNMRLQAAIGWRRAIRRNIILMSDISKGREKNPIQCCNTVDEAPPPVGYTYITMNCLTSPDIHIDSTITSLHACTCTDRCPDAGAYCQCTPLAYNSGWYDNNGRLPAECSSFADDIPMIFECNTRCNCNYITCTNRVVQKGITQRFQLFRTEGALKGWGIRALKLIPRGSFVCEYVGEIISEGEADRRPDDSYIFDLDTRSLVQNNANEGEQKEEEEEEDGYCIDAKFYGNFARFINHSCQPNLTSIKVFVDHQDLKFPRIAFFATKNIQPNEELCYDYGEKFWIVKHKEINCHCGSFECRYGENTT